jgi:hypothetical protein
LEEGNLGAGNLGDGKFGLPGLILDHVLTFS